MPVKDLPYNTLEPLVKKYISTEEWEGTVILMKEFRSVKKNGFLTKEELIKVCYWKSPRAIKYIKSNRADAIKRITGMALGSRKEHEKITELIKLKGVSIPMASSILTLVNPKQYGVMDIRVWQLLYQTGIATTNPKGTAFKIEEWLLFLNTLRHFSKKMNVTARDVERTLFLIHKKYQEGLLYGGVKNNDSRIFGNFNLYTNC
jgi:hypothetical protein